VHQGALGGADQLGPALVDVLAQGGRGVGDLAVDDEVDEVFGLVLLDGPADEAEFACRLLATLAEVALVEGEPQFSVLEHEIVARAVVAASVHRVGIICVNPALPAALN
jgi:hypothetical protein